MARIEGQILAITALAGVLSGAAAPQEAKSDAAPKYTVDQLAWIAGKWRGTSHGATAIEMWTEPAGGMMLGVGHTYLGNKTRFFEFLRIETSRDGQVAYVAQPKGGNPTAFPLTQLDGQHAVFENPQHDMPKKIIYKRSGDDLTARIEGDEKGKPASDEYQFKRVTD